MASTSSKKTPNGKEAAPKRPKGPVMPRAGKTIDGIEFITTHSCPGCQAVMETIGPGYPQFVCARCTMYMVSKSKKVGS